MNNRESMTLNEFKHMRPAQKADMVWEWAYYITCTRYGNYSIAIFALADFYVEVYLNVSQKRTELIKGLSLEELTEEDRKSVEETCFLNRFKAENEIETVKRCCSREMKSLILN